MEKYKFQAKSKDDLLDKALQELNVKEDEVFTKFYEEKGGLFSGKKYTIEVVKLTDIAETGKDILLELLNALNIQSNVETKIRDKKIKYEIFSKNNLNIIIFSEQNSLLIGKKGHILNSIQIYVKQSLYTMLDIYIDLSIDVENYRQKQDYFLEKNAKKIGREVTLSKINIKLDPMNSYERKIVHSALQKYLQRCYTLYG